MSPPWTNLAGLAIGGPLYGIYFVLYISSTYLLIQRSTGAHAGAVYRSAIFVSGVVLFLAITGNFILTVVRPFIGFVYFLNGTEPAVFFNDNSQISTTIQNGCAAIAILVNDCIIIYRLWIVWSRNKFVIILPILTTLGLAIALGLSVQTTTHVDSIAEDKGLTPGLVFTLVTNMYSTGLISWKIWQITKSSSAVSGNRLREFVGIIIESAAIFTIWGFFYIISHQINSDLQFIALIPLPAIAGISNALIQARMGMGQTIERRLPSTGQSHSVSFPSSGSAGAALRMTTRQGTDTGGMMSRSDIYEMKPMSV
ncbi:hypothetical protein K438DRAFT_1966719 [Mycena galopus ATCC 62051]|nr:hypothetical protein K438DRAFT_1966719 [Mycena galopus ATCC 62051]